MTEASRRRVGTHRVEQSLEACLRLWLVPFKSSWTRWGFINDARPDNTTYQRHGIIVTLPVDISELLSMASRAQEEPLRRLRQAIDMVTLTLEVDPLAIKSLLRRRSWITPILYEDDNDHITEDELQDLAQRDVPFELRVRLQLRGENLSLLHEYGVERFCKTFDCDEVDHFDELRGYLLDQALRSQWSRRLERLPVCTVLSVTFIGAPAEKYTSYGLSLRHIENASESLRGFQDKRIQLWASLFLIHVELTDNDATNIRRELALWRQQHPTKRLRLKELHVTPKTGSINTIRALLEAIDDVEKVSWRGSEELVLAEDITKLLQFPSLRRLFVENVQIPSMEIFTTSGENPRELQLELLKLSGLALTDSASTTEFIKSLDPQSGFVSSLSRTLQELVIAEMSNLNTVGANADDRPLTRLAINNVYAVKALNQVLAANNGLQYVNVIGDFRQHAVIPIHPGDYAAVRSQVRAPIAVRRDALAMARKAAFLSVIRDGSCTAPRHLDSNAIRVVFEFMSPLVLRRVRI